VNMKSSSVNKGRPPKKNEELISHAKVLWEKARAFKGVTPEERRQHNTRLIEHIEGKLVEIIYKHDASRMIQTCIKYGTKEQRDQIFVELKPKILDLAKNHYGHFLVYKMLKYMPDHRSTIVSVLKGQLRALLQHKDASMIVEAMYTQATNRLSKFALMTEFFGAEMTIYAKQKGVTCLKDILEQENEAKRPYILTNLRKNLEPILNKGVPIIRSTMVHSLVLEIFSNDSFANQYEVMGDIKEVLVEYVHTKEGAAVGVRCVDIANTKDRKVIMKGMKGYVHQTAKEEYGHVVVLRLLDVVDDSVFIIKSILNELLKDLNGLLFDPYGRLSFLMIYAHNNPRYFTPKVIEYLQPPMIPSKDEEGVEQMVVNYKKTPEDRRAALLAAVSKPLQDFCSENVSTMLVDKYASDVIYEVVNGAEGGELVDKVVETVLADASLREQILPMRIVKNWIKTNSSFRSKLLEGIDSGLMEWVKENKGTQYAVLALLEAVDTRERVCSMLKKQKKAIEQLEDPTAKLIIQKLE